MKLTSIKNKLRTAWQWTSGQAQMIWHWFKNLCFVFLLSKSEPRVFMGYGHWWFAKKYADRRYRMSCINKTCGGKRHYVLPWSDYSLIVVDRLELIRMKSKGLLRNKMKRLNNNRKNTRGRINEYNPSGKRIRHSSEHQFGGARNRNLQAIYIPQRTVLKGYMKEVHLGSRRSGYYFNSSK